MVIKGGSSHYNQQKSTSTSKIITFIVGLIALCWSLFMILHIYKPHLIEESKENKPIVTDVKKVILISNTSQLIHNERKETQKDKINIITSTTKKNENTIHVIFSTDCSFYQDWQTLLIFHSALTVGQKGDITRIASGCVKEKQKKLIKLYKKLYPKYHIHFTPDFKKDKKTEKEYDFYNKPYGIEHWLDNNIQNIPDGVVVAIIDPDMIFLRPLTVNVREKGMLLLPGATEIPSVIEKGI